MYDTYIYIYIHTLQNAAHIDIPVHVYMYKSQDKEAKQKPRRTSRRSCPALATTPRTRRRPGELQPINYILLLSINIC